jgi:hypothetical protein
MIVAARYARGPRKTALFTREFGSRPGANSKVVSENAVDAALLTHKLGDEQGPHSVGKSIGGPVRCRARKWTFSLITAAGAALSAEAPPKASVAPGRVVTSLPEWTTAAIRPFLPY